MRLYEFGSYSVGDSLVFEMFEELKSRNLLENNKNIEEYKSYIEQEKSNTIDIHNLNQNSVYFPVGLQSVPTGEIILVKYTEYPSTFVDTNMGKLYFISNNKSIDFPITRNVGDGLLDTLVYSSQQDQLHFMTTLKLKFSSWTIRIDKV